MKENRMISEEIMYCPFQDMCAKVRMVRLKEKEDLKKPVVSAADQIILESLSDGRKVYRCFSLDISNQDRNSAYRDKCSYLSMLNNTL